MPRLPKQIIMLECPPGEPCPGDLIEGITDGTGLPRRKAPLVTAGAWQWDYDDVPEERWKEAEPILKQRIEDLYRRGVIRAGAWGGSGDGD